MILKKSQDADKARSAATLFVLLARQTQKEAITPANETRLGRDLPRRAPQRWPKFMALSAHTGSWRVAAVFYARRREPPVWV